MAGQGSTGNVIAALCSFFIPGLGQLIQGRLLMAIVQFVLAAILWIVLLGWVIHLWSIIDETSFEGEVKSTPDSRPPNESCGRDGISARRGARTLLLHVVEFDQPDASRPGLTCNQSGVSAGRQSDDDSGLISLRRCDA